MFRSTLRSFARNNELKSIQSRLFNTSDLSRRRPREINNVKLCGTVYNKVFTLPSGSTKFYLKTVQPNKVNYQVHKVQIVNQNLQNIIGDSLEVGQRLYISGKLSSNTFTTEDDKTRQSAEIKAYELFLCNNENDEPENAEYESASSGDSDIANSDENAVTDANATGNNDINYVEILAQVSTDILNLDEFSVFSLATHHTFKTGLNEGTERTDFHRVFVYDKSLLEFVRNKLNKLDRVIVEGTLNYKTIFDKEGKKQSNGCIVATNILKVSKFEGRSNESVASENE